MIFICSFDVKILSCKVIASEHIMFNSMLHMLIDLLCNLILPKATIREFHLLLCGMEYFGVHLNYRCLITNVWISIIKTRQSHHQFISLMEMPIPGKFLYWNWTRSLQARCGKYCACWWSCDDRPLWFNVDNNQLYRIISARLTNVCSY